MVIRAIDKVAAFNTASDGEVLRTVLLKELKKSPRVILSFEGVTDVPSSFVNASIVSLLENYNPNDLRKRLIIIDSTKQIADMVRRCMSNGIAKLL